MQELVQTKSKDGTTIAYARAGGGPPLVLVHGTGADHTRWAPLLPRLTERFTVCAMDRRGRRGSGDAPSYALEREFEDIVAVVEDVGEPVYLLGHSHGAVCSLEALRRTDRVRRAVLYEPPLPLDSVVTDSAIVNKLDALMAENDRQGVLETFYREVVHMPASAVALIRSLPEWQGHLMDAHTIPREFYVLRGPEQYRFRPQQFARVTVPTLLLLGGDSPARFKEAINAVGAALPNSRVVVLPGQQHTAMDTAPELFLREVTSFFCESK